jgi:hypothetical protein
MTKKNTPNYIGLIHELQTHKEPFIIRPLLERFRVNRYTTSSLRTLGYITTTGVKRAMRCQWVGLKNPTLGQVQMMAKAVERENRKAWVDINNKRRAKNTTIPSGTYEAPLMVKAPVVDTEVILGPEHMKGPLIQTQNQPTRKRTPTRPSRRLSILWGLFAWESK